MMPTSDFDPLKCLEDLQQGFISLAQAQKILNDNQGLVTQQIKMLWSVIERQQAQIDLLAEQLGLSDPTAKKAAINKTSRQH